MTHPNKILMVKIYRNVEWKLPMSSFSKDCGDLQDDKLNNIG